MEQPDANLINLKQWEFPTMPSRPPLALRMEARRLRDGEKTLHLEINGLVHPYLGDAGYVGDETKNPALLPVALHIEHIMAEEVRRYMDANPALRQANRSVLQKEADEYKRIAAMDFHDLVMEFNPYSYQGRFQYTPVSDADVSGLFDALSARIEAARPEIEAALKENAHLQPPEKPTPQQVRGVERKVGHAWAQAMRDVERKGMGRARGGSLPPPHEDN